MENFIKLNLKLLYCYQNVTSKEEAEEKCQGYADEAKNYFNNGNLKVDFLLRKTWCDYYSNFI